MLDFVFTGHEPLRMTLECLSLPSVCMIESKVTKVLRHFPLHIRVTRKRFCPNHFQVYQVILNNFQIAKTIFWSNFHLKSNVIVKCSKLMQLTTLAYSRPFFEILSVYTIYFQWRISSRYCTFLSSYMLEVNRVLKILWSKRKIAPLSKKSLFR